MSEQEKKRKAKAIIATVIFHGILLILFLIYGLKQPVPLPEEGGATVEFGWDNTAGGADIANVVSKTPEPEVKPEPQKSEPVQTTDDVEEMATEENSAVEIPKQENKPAPVKPTEPEKKPEPTVSDKLNNALDNAWNTPSGGGSQGDDSGEGNQGNPNGSDGKGVLGGGSGSWQLDGRSMLPGYGTKISTTREEGIVVLNIWVDKQGRVTRVLPNLKESNTTSQYLINLAKTDVLENFVFNADPSAAVEQRGKVRYVFQLK